MNTARILIKSAMSVKFGAAETDIGGPVEEEMTLYSHIFVQYSMMKKAMLNSG